LVALLSLNSSYHDPNERKILFAASLISKGNLSFSLTLLFEIFYSLFSLLFMVETMALAKEIMKKITKVS
jgi:hypothetical protein